METATQQEIKAVVTNQCLCKECPNCSEEQGAWYGEETNCPECGAEFDIPYYCYEDPEETWTDVVDNFFTPWIESNWDRGVTQFIVKGRGATWRRTSGSTGLMTSFNEVKEFLTGDYDWWLEFSYNKTANTLSVMRSSHEEPMGAYFELVVPDWDWIDSVYGGQYPEILSLYQWSTNYNYPTPFSLFLDIVGYSSEHYGTHLCGDKWPDLGSVELEYLGDALKEFANLYNCEELLGVLLQLN